MTSDRKFQEAPTERLCARVLYIHEAGHRAMKTPLQAAYGRQSWRRLAAAQVRSSPRCQVCGRTTNLVAGHRIPPELGGPMLSAQDLLTLCRGCNHAMGREPVDLWMTRESYARRVASARTPLVSRRRTYVAGRRSPGRVETFGGRASGHLISLGRRPTGRLSTTPALAAPRLRSTTGDSGSCGSSCSLRR